MEDTKKKKKKKEELLPEFKAIADEIALIQARLRLAKWQAKQLEKTQQMAHG